MQCLARTGKRCRCKNPGCHWFGLFCHQHRSQPCKWLGKFLAVGAALAGLIGLYLTYQGNAETRQLRQAVSRIESDCSDRFDKKYPLGYCLLAIHGSKKIVIPANKDVPVELDWDGMYLESITDNRVGVVFPYLKDKRLGNVFYNCRASIETKPGATFTLYSMPTLRVDMECVRASPIGLFIVVGFVDPSKNNSQTLPLEHFGVGIR